MLGLLPPLSSFPYSEISGSSGECRDHRRADRWVTESYLIKPFTERPLYPLMLTFGFSVAITDLMRMIFGTVGQIVPLPTLFTGSLMWGGVFIPNTGYSSSYSLWGF